MSSKHPPFASEISNTNICSQADEPEQSSTSFAAELDFLGEEVVEESCFGEDIESAVVEFGTLGEDDHQEDLQVEADASTGNATLSFSEGFSGEIKRLVA